MNILTIAFGPLIKTWRELFHERSVQDLVQQELDEALRTQLKYASLIENYNAAQSANNIRIARLKRYLIDLEIKNEKRETKDYGNSYQERRVEPNGATVALQDTFRMFGKLGGINKDLESAKAEITVR